SVMGLIEEAGLEIVESVETPAKRGRKQAADEDPFDALVDTEDGEDRPGSSTETEPEEAETELSRASLADITEKIDDPVRMYLTQMGEIPLLTREEEISLARKIELTRKQFRQDTLSSGFGVAAAIEILEDVVRGELAFDRTLKVNQQDPEVGKADLSDRLPVNIETMRRLYEAARADYERLVKALEGGKSPRDPEVVRLKRRIFARRRRGVLLVEELNLQGKKIRPIIDLL